ncbi:centrosome-associated protein 350-like isoform X1 [Vespula squamosa]|uniref:Centrosome-associated protein 350-like isoform X1 n=1 Tax=Vespula squamosa TaxID=30214 RepID=A0ABD2AE48_VESSQ
MSNNCKKEDIGLKKKYVFFNDPDIIVKRAESLVNTQLRSHLGLKKQQVDDSKQDLKEKTNDIPQLDFKNVENLLSFHPVQPYPFTFISAVKRKLSLGDHPDTQKKLYDSGHRTEAEVYSRELKFSTNHNLYQAMQNMAFREPLKVPDLKMSTKTLDYSSKDNPTSKDVAGIKLAVSSNDFVPERSEKTSRERVQRKLDFSLSEGPSVIACENIEPLKAPNVSIASSFSKKKEHVRESSREKENRSKRIRKDDSLYTKSDEILYSSSDFSKRSKSPRHVSRKDITDNTSGSISVGRIKTDRLPLFVPRESDFVLTKPKTKNFATSTARKDNDKKHRCSNVQSAKLRDTSLECKNKTGGNELHSQKNIIKDTARSMVFDSIEYKCKEDLQSLKQTDEHKYKLENKQVKQQNKVLNQSLNKQAGIGFKEHNKRVYDKTKTSINRIEGKHYVTYSDTSGDIEIVSDSNTSLKKRSSTCSAVLTQQSQSKDIDKSQTMQSLHSKKSGKDNENSNYIENSSLECTDISSNKNEAFSQDVNLSNKLQSSNNDLTDLNESSLPEALLDPRRISFRDDNYTQDEFRDLVTPDMNLIFRSKRKKQMAQSNDTNIDCGKTSKYKTSTKPETIQHGIQLLHPTALHMQFQAELHLLDSMNESLRQVMDVEKSFYNVKNEQEKELIQKQNQATDELILHLDDVGKNGTIDKENTDKVVSQINDNTGIEKVVTDKRMTNKIDEASFIDEQAFMKKEETDEQNNNLRKRTKSVIEVAEVQTQTVNDIGTQTDIYPGRRNLSNRFLEIHENAHGQELSLEDCEIPLLSLGSRDQFEDLDQLEDLSLPSKVRTMSEISLHETTSSIKTETGTEISISTRDVTCSFNKYLDLEIAQLIKDEKQRYDKIEMLFKSREKTLHDRTKKLVKLEEQKRALRDTGQDSRISSVKKKQRALLLKLQQEKDEMNRLKELHKIASQERKLMLQKQRNMFNPQMSTKNILTKLKRSADSQSPRRLSGPMKGYDIRSNSSMSSLVDSDKSQHDKSQIDPKIQLTENDMQFQKVGLSNVEKIANLADESNISLLKYDKLNDTIEDLKSQNKYTLNSQKGGNKLKYELRSRKFEEKMPKADIIKLRSHQLDVESKLMQGHCVNVAGHVHEKQKTISLQSLQDLDNTITEYIKSESDTLVDELSKKSKSSQVDFRSVISSKDKEPFSRDTAVNTETIQEQITSIEQDALSKTSKSSQVSEDTFQTHSRNSNKTDKSISSDKEITKKFQQNSEFKASTKRKNSKCQRTRSSSTILTENILRSKSSSQIEEFTKHHNKRTKIENEFIQSDRNDEGSILDELDLSTDQTINQNAIEVLIRQSNAMKDKNSKLFADIIDESKENISVQNVFERSLENYSENNYPSKDKGKNAQNCGDISARSQLGTFAISNHNSVDNEKEYTRSIVIRSQNHDFKTSKKLEQILNAREAALVSRRNCVEEWMAWDARLRAEEERVARMEQAAYKLVTATSALSHQDSTLSSDTSDVEGRIELLTEKLAERRIEMSRLKKEARKQTKQKLKALEANLLNQIKKYDTTIHEMRKKLESRKESVKDSDKLAIESKSLAEFKVPDIPLKRIQEIYKNSDLLRSRSESDLLSTKIQQKGIVKNIQALIYESKCEETNFSKSSQIIKRDNVLESSNTKKQDIHYNVQSIFADLKDTEYEKLRSISMSSTSDDDQGEKATHYNTTFHSSGTQTNHTLVSVPEQFTVAISSDNNSKDIQSEISVVNTDTDILTESELKLSKSHRSDQLTITEPKSDLIDVEQVPLKSLISQSNTIETSKAENLKLISNKSESYIQNSNMELACTNNDSGTLTYSKKLHFLQLNNKNLNEDINCLENELKALSEMMSRISSLSAEKHDNEEKSTLKDISEVFSKSELTDNNTSNKDINKTIQSDITETEIPVKTDINSEISSYSASILKLKSGNESTDLVENASHVISGLIPEEETLFSESNQEIDYKAESKKILNEIEKSIISEHAKIIEGDTNSSSIPLETNVQKIQKLNKDFPYYLSTSDIDKKTESPIPIEENKNLKHSKNTPECSLDKKMIDEQHVVQESQLLVQESYGEKLSENVDSISTNISEQCPISEDDSLKKDNDVVVNKSILHFENISQFKNNEDTLQIENISSAENNEIHLSSRDFSNTEQINTGQYYNSNSKDEENIISQNANTLSINLNKRDFNVEENESEVISTEKMSVDKDDWTISDSFNICHDEAENEWEKTQNHEVESHINVSSDHKNISQEENDVVIQDFTENLSVSIEDESMLLPRAESTNIDALNLKINETDNEKTTDELDDILDIIARENDKEYDNEEKQYIGTEKTDENIDNIKSIKASIALGKENENNELINEINIQTKIILDADNIDLTIDSPFPSITCDSTLDDKLQIQKLSTSDNNKSNITPLCTEYNKNINASNDALDVPSNKLDDVSVVNIKLNLEIEGKDIVQEEIVQSREIIISKADSGSTEDILSQLEISTKIELSNEELIDKSNTHDDNKETHVSYYPVTEKESTPLTVKDQGYLELLPEPDSSDGEQLDNLVEVAESGLDVIEKLPEPAEIHSNKSTSLSKNKEDNIEIKDLRENEDLPSDSQSTQKDNIATTNATDIIIKVPFEVLRDPEYEDISEESLEVSEILDKTESQKTQGLQKGTIVPENYQAVHKTEVLRILDEITQKSLPELIKTSQDDKKDVQTVGTISTKALIHKSSLDNENKIIQIDQATDQNTEIVKDTVSDNSKLTEIDTEEASTKLNDLLSQSDEKHVKTITAVDQSAIQKHEDVSSDSSEGGDTPAGVSEIEIDSPRDLNNSRLNIDVLDDDLLSNTNMGKQDESKTDFHATAIVTTSEKDIEAMIDKIKASLKQPGLEVADLEAKLLRIQQLQIELEIKKLEAEEVYYVREIPNKPPPPYTPPGDNRISIAIASPSPPPAVIPSNIEELTAFTEKATALIYKAKQSGQDIMNLEAPPEICELTKESNEIAKKDRKIYNTFLFDLCKETISEVYQAEYEKPGPSWTKPNVKTKPAMKIPKTVEELHEYVSKEVATLFGFKTKLQRENMVMRWSRKRRDRVDELLAREAQAEEDEWTKFHHDELAVKNGLTVAILETLIMETTSVVKVAHAKKRKVMI